MQTCSADVAWPRQLAVAVAAAGKRRKRLVLLRLWLSVLVGAFEQQCAASTLLIRSRLAEEKAASFISLKLVGQDENKSTF